MAEKPDQPVAQPHDKFFKDQFLQPGMAQSILARTLPRDLADSIDWEKLIPEETAFIDETLAGSACDLLFRTEYKARPALIYLLFEHLSAPDPEMPFRMLRYMVRIWERHWDRTSQKTPPAILPVVFHQGAAPWPYSGEFHDWLRLAANDPLRAFQPSFAHLLIDLPKIDLDRLLLPVREKLTLLLMKCVRENCLTDYYEEVTSLFLAYLKLTDDNQRVAVLLRYLMSSETRRENGTSTIRPLIVKLNSQKPEASIMTIYDAILEEGMEKGLAKGLAKGREEGREEGELRGVLLGQILTLQDLLSGKTSTRQELSLQSIEQLEAFRDDLKRRLAGRF